MRKCIISGFRPISNANPNLQWETSKKLDLGFNFTMFNDRLSVEFDYYNNAVDGLILKAPAALSAGIPGNYINANVGSLYNKGIELGLNAIIANDVDFKWDGTNIFRSNQEMNTSVMYYVIEYNTTIDDKKVISEGNITLVK